MRGYPAREESPQWRGLYRVVLTILSCAAIVLLVVTVSTFKAAPLPTPGPTQTAHVVLVDQVKVVTAIPTVTATRKATKTPAPPVPTRMRFAGGETTGRMGER